MKTKICIKCSKTLPATSEYFRSRKNNKDGLRNECKKCYNKYAREYKKNNADKIKNSKKKYYELNKEKISEKNSLYYKCNKEHILNLNKEYYKLNKQYILKRSRIQSKEWYLNNKDKAKYKNERRRSIKSLLPSNLNSHQWKNIKLHFKNKCAYCGKELPLEQEHFIPLSKGGEYTINNIIPACKSCNCSKRNTDFFEWYPNQKFYSKIREKKILKYLNYKNYNQQLILLK